MKALAPLLNALQNADTANIGQWPLALRGLSVVVASGLMILALWQLHLDNLYQKMQALQVQKQQVTNEIRMLTQARSSTKSPIKVEKTAVANQSPFAQLQSSAAKDGVRFLRIVQPKPHSAFSQHELSVAQQQKGKSATSLRGEWKVEMYANYEQWLNWMQSLATSDWLWMVRDFDIKRRDAFPDKQNLHINLTLLEAGPRHYERPLATPTVSHLGNSKWTKISNPFATPSLELHKTAGKQALLQSPSMLATGDLFELIGTVEFEKPVEAVAHEGLESKDQNQSVYQATIRQGSRIHILNLGESLSTKEGQQEWRLIAANERNVLLRETKSGREQRLALPSTKEEMKP
jgi:Tfp pilus assembly protein PilO